MNVHASTRAWAGVMQTILSQTGYFFNSNSVWAVGFFPNIEYNSIYSGAPGDIYLNVSSPGASLPSYDPGSQGWFLLLHELLHTLGLKHPHDDGGTGRPTFSQLGLGSLDINWATVMSYNDGANWNLFTWKPSTPMALDVLALQYLYGKNLKYNIDNTDYKLTEANFFYTLWDAGGVDTLDASTATTGWTIELPNIQLTTLVDTKVGYAAPTNELSAGTPRTLVWLTGDYEHINGSSFTDIITGNLFSNTIYGGGGNDSISGGAGNDALYGGAGNDTLYGGEGNDNFIYTTTNEGVDIIADLQIGDNISFIGRKFTSTAIAGNGSSIGLNEVQYEKLGGNTYIYIGADNTPGHDNKILLYGNFNSNQFSLSNSNITIVSPINRLPTGAVTITGMPSQGQTLNVTNTLSDADGLGSITYTWKANGTAIGTGSSFKLTQSEVGKVLTATATYTDLSGAVESVTSTATTAVVNVNDAPLGSVTIAGTPTQGQTLNVTNTLSDADGLGSITYTWKANGTTIGTGSSFKLTQSEVGKVLTATATYTDLSGAVESVTSTATTAVVNVNDAPQGSVTINGIAAIGQILSVSNSVTDLDGIPLTGNDSFNYQWRINGSEINGATALTYSIKAEDLGKNISVITSYKDNAGKYETVISNATDLISSKNYILGDETANQIQGTIANDYIYGLDGNDSLYGFEGSDTLYGGMGNDLLKGGIGTDTAILSIASTGMLGISFDATGFFISTSEGKDYLDSDIEKIQFSDTKTFDLSIVSELSSSSGLMVYSSGNDYIGLLGGDLDIALGGGDDTIVISSQGQQNFITGGSGDDTVVLSGMRADWNFSVLTVSQAQELLTLKYPFNPAIGTSTDPFTWNTSALDLVMVGRNSETGTSIYFQTENLRFSGDYPTTYLSETMLPKISFTEDATFANLTQKNFFGRQGTEDTLNLKVADVDVALKYIGSMIDTTTTNPAVLLLANTQLAASTSVLLKAQSSNTSWFNGSSTVGNAGYNLVDIENIRIYDSKGNETTVR